MFVYDFLDSNVPLAFENYFIPVKTSHEHSTRAARNKQIQFSQKSTTEYGIKSVTYQSINHLVE